MTIAGINHVQIAMPRGAEADVRRFYGELLGLREIPKPAPIAMRGGAWFEVGSLQLHFGVDPDFRAARKAHVAFDVEDYEALIVRCRTAGHEPRFDTSLPDCRRFFVDDPFGNRLELIEASTTAVG